MARAEAGSSAGKLRESHRAASYSVNHAACTAGSVKVGRSLSTTSALGYNREAMSRQVYGKYELISRIATGGMAEVWLGRSSSIGGFEKLVALKRLHPRLVRQPGLVSLFIEEAKLSVALSHPNIVHVFDFGEVDGDYYIAMEYVDGLDLSTLAKRARERKTPLPVGVVAYVVREVLEGLAYAHGNKKGRAVTVIHRDVSPHNVLVSFDGQVKLSDFGIAQAIGALSTDQGQVVGKSAYISPEQARGEAVSPATDLWSAGVVLYELLAGARLFVRETEEDTLAAVERGPISPPSALNPHVPPALDALTLALLERDASKRPESARKAAEALSTILREHYPTVDDYRVSEVIGELGDDDTLTPAAGYVVERTSPGARASRTAPVDDELVLAFEHTSPGLGAPPPQVAELKKVFLQDPNLWILYDLGEAYAGAAQLAPALGAYRVAMAKFAQAGLLVQALTIATRILELTGPTPRTLAEIRQLPTLTSLTDAALVTQLGAHADESSDPAECVALLRAREGTPSQILEAQILAAPIFSSLDGDQLLRLAGALVRREFAPATRIVSEGEQGTTFFWIGRGRVVVSTTNFEGRRVYLTSLTDGDTFGEQSFFTGQPRNANVEAMDPVLALEIAQDTLAELVREFPDVEGELRTFYKERIAESLLARSSLFGHLAVRERKRLAAYFTYTQAKRGELILREGDTSDAFYALRQGRVSVFTGGLDDTTGLPLAELGPGEVFGEVAALKGARRTASVRALSDAELLRIEASDLQEFLAANAEVRAMIEDKIEARAAETIQRLHESS